MTGTTPSRGLDAWRRAVAAYRKRQRAGRARGYRPRKDPFSDAIGVRKAAERGTDTTNERTSTP